MVLGSFNEILISIEGKYDVPLIYNLTLALVMPVFVNQFSRVGKPQQIPMAIDNPVENVVGFNCSQFATV